MKQKLITMLSMQDEFNKVVHPNWREQNYKFTDAIMVEAVEAFDHYGWKWWKKQTPDLDQVKLELVDIWHFGMSELMTHKTFSEEKLATTLEFVMTVETRKQDFADSVRYLIECASIGVFTISTFHEVMRGADLTWEELFKLYVGKNTLNKFRQDNGYKTGEYIKDWNGKEDNVVLMEILGRIDLDSKDVVTLVYKKLEKEYEAISGTAA
jgi:dimeric dUTPase (all-alpha-NTP-PPase superfamily)